MGAFVVGPAPAPSGGHVAPRYNQCLTDPPRPFEPARFSAAPPMTTLVIVRKNNEVAIAADSLTTFGDTRLPAQFDRASDKIVHFRGTYIGLCGSAAHQLVFESLLAKQGDLDFSNKRAIFETEGRGVQRRVQASVEPVIDIHDADWQ